MANEKAKELIAMIEVKEPNELIVNSWWGSFAKDYKEALQMAIEALEQEPCEDAISRQAVMYALCDICELFHKNGEETCLTKCESYRFLATLPSVEPKKKTEWIPVSERLPENNGTYLVWDKYGYQISDFNAEEQTFGFLNECNFDYETGEVYPPCWVEHDTVIAWMPLPAPFEPQESEIRNE